jgi:hypothetical protein
MGELKHRRRKPRTHDRQGTGRLQVMMPRAEQEAVTTITDQLVLREFASASTGRAVDIAAAGGADVAPTSAVAAPTQERGAT